MRMHKIIETFADKTLEVETDNLFDTALSVSDFVKSLNAGRFRTVDQSFQTDGPNDRVKMIFTVNKNFDRKTKATISFSVFGEYEKLSKRKGLLMVRIKGKIETVLSASEGIASSALDDFYLKNIYKILIENTKDSYNKLLKQVKKEFP